MNEYSITVVEYAKVEHFNNTMIYGGYYGTGETRITYTVDILKSGNECIIVDSGYDMADHEAAEHAKAEGHAYYKTPAECLLRAGVNPDDVKHVILTHAHWDHMGGVHFFKNAKFYLQEAELLNWIKIMAMSSEYNTLKNPMAYANIEEAVSLMKDGRLVLLKGNVEQLFPGIDIRIAEFGHSFAQNVVYVNTANGAYAISGDTAYVKENVIGVNGSGVSLPNGYAIGSIINSVTTMQDILKAVGNDANKIIFGHDDKMWADYDSKLFDDNLHIAYVAK